MSEKRCPLTFIDCADPNTKVRTRINRVAPYVMQAIFRAGMPFVIPSRRFALRTPRTTATMETSSASPNRSPVKPSRTSVSNGALKDGSAA